MKSITSVITTIFFTLGLTSAALAQEETATQEGTATQERTAPQPGTDKTLPIPMTLNDLSGKSNVQLSLPMLPGHHYFLMAPMVSGQYAIGDLSLGLAVPMAAYFPKHSDSGDDSFALGNITANVLYRHCSQGDWSACFGAGLKIGASVKELDRSENSNEGTADIIGIWAHEDFTYHWPESLVISPVLVAGVTNGIFVGQVELGTSILIPTIHREIGSGETRDTEAVLNFGVGAGVKVLDLVIPLIELRILDFLTAENGYDIDPLVWLSFGARFQLGNFSPMFRLSIPLNELSKLDAPVQLEVALAYQF